MSIEQLHEITHIDPWFLDILKQIVETEKEILDADAAQPLTAELMRRAKNDGFSDKQIAELRDQGESELDIRAMRLAYDIKPVYRRIDTCAAEFEAYTPYFYSAYGNHNEAEPGDKKKIMVLGSGPNRIGQGIEFDYCCVHTIMALRNAGYETIMVNSNPETVSTDYDTSDKLYFEPLTFEDVMNIYENEKPEGVIVQMGGQTPLNLSVPLSAAGVPVLGTSSDSIDRAEDRERCRVMLEDLGIKQPASATANNIDEVVETSRKIGLPVMIRPSYVLGGRAMMIAYEEEDVIPFATDAFAASPEHPILLDRFLDGATELDVDVLCDGENVFVGGVMEHIEQAGVHSGDSACSTPPYSLSDEIIAEVEETCTKIAIELKVKGLCNVQLAVFENEVYIIEINPRASRTAPFLAKATGVQLAKLAARIAVGEKISDLGLPATRIKPDWYAVKEAVFPFNKFAGVDPTLSPEMKSTGEVMGIDPNFEVAYWKSQIAAYQNLPDSGIAFLSANDNDKVWIAEVAAGFAACGLEIIATEGTAAALKEKGVEAKVVNKLASGQSPTVKDYMQEDNLALVINTPSGPVSRADEVEIRSEAILRRIPIITTEAGARATAKAMLWMKDKDWDVKALQDYSV